MFLDEFQCVFKEISQQYPETNDGWDVSMLSLREQFGDEITAAFSFTLFGAVAFVLLLACANVIRPIAAK